MKGARRINLGEFPVVSNSPGDPLYLRNDWHFRTVTAVGQCRLPRIYQMPWVDYCKSLAPRSVSTLLEEILRPYLMLFVIAVAHHLSIPRQAEELCLAPAVCRLCPLYRTVRSSVIRMLVDDVFLPKIFLRFRPLLRNILTYLVPIRHRMDDWVICGSMNGPWIKWTNNLQHEVRHDLYSLDTSTQTSENI
ncbi:hypothetical protein BDW75DRAFT_156292 [Aspergillus navahoensis]